MSVVQFVITFIGGGLLFALVWAEPTPETRDILLFVANVIFGGLLLGLVEFTWRRAKIRQWERELGQRMKEIEERKP